MGVRSMATLVRTSRHNVIIDPGVALGPRRFGYSPHRRELEALKRCWRRVKKALIEADIVIITHYHYDHFNPQEVKLFRGKRIFLKDPENWINRSQKKRAYGFLMELGNLAHLIFADGKRFELDGINLYFSRPVPHGENMRLGFVLQVVIEEGSFRFLHSSDVGGYPLKDQNLFALMMNPSVMFLDGPATYMVGGSVLQSSIINMQKLLRIPSLQTVILDHHVLRDMDWKSSLEPFLNEAKKRGIEVMSAAQFMGLNEEPLEAMRGKLYGKA